ncbi:MAG: LemA family protein [Proteobacteria bacterium]|nr:LemA family protein [Pseudomonadota bacterium]
MQNPLVKVFAFFAVLTGIILFCTIFGGYTSFYRNENRIESARTALVESCQERLALMPALITLMQKMVPGDAPESMDQTLAKTAALQKDVLQQKLPLEEQKSKDFETSETALTLQVKDMLAQLKPVADQKNMGEFEALKQKLHKAQDNLYMAGYKYNDEVLYFRKRLKSIPVTYIAKMFGFDKILYYPFSEQAFLPARKTFEP